jgi:putative transposase
MQIRLECIGWVRLAEKDRIPADDYRITSLRVTRQGNNWFASINVIQKDCRNQFVPENQGIGIDLGIKDFAVSSDGKVYKNINKSTKIKKLEKRLKRLQRRVSRKYDMNKTKIEGGEDRYKFTKTNNIRKLEYEIQAVRDRLNNIRTDYLHKISDEIIKRKPIFITIEDINIKGIMKNRHLARCIAQQNFYEFRRILTYKCRWNNIELRIADRFFPSSKLCSCCGSVKKDLKLSDRIYKCECGNVIDRDYQASVNLFNSPIYEVAI